MRNRKEVGRRNAEVGRKKWEVGIRNADDRCKMTGVRFRVSGGKGPSSPRQADSGGKNHHRMARKITENSTLNGQFDL